MDLPPDKAKQLRGYDDEKKWNLICNQVIKIFYYNKYILFMVIYKKNDIMLESNIFNLKKCFKITFLGLKLTWELLTKLSVQQARNTNYKVMYSNF